MNTLMHMYVCGGVCVYMYICIYIYTGGCGRKWKYARRYPSVSGE